MRYIDVTKSQAVANARIADRTASQQISRN